MIEQELVTQHQPELVAPLQNIIRDYFHRAAHERCSAQLGRDWRAPAPPLKKLAPKYGPMNLNLAA